MELDFEKMNGLVPAIIQDNETRKVLMLGFMNKEAYDKTVETGKVTFFSRTKNRLWTKGEEISFMLFLSRPIATMIRCSFRLIRQGLCAIQVQIPVGARRMKNL